MATLYDGQNRWLTANSPPPKDSPLWRSQRTPLRVLDGREAPGKFSLLYIQFPVLGFEIPVPRIFFQYQDWNPGTRDFFYWRVWSLFGDLFFFNYFFGKKFIKKNCHQKVTKLFSKNLLKSRYPGFSRMTPLPKDTTKGFRTQKVAVLGGGSLL